MRLERPQHLADGLVAGLSFREGSGDVAARFDWDRHHDVAEALTCFFRLSHDPSDGLHDIDLAVARLHEHDRVECRNIHSFAEELHVRQQPQSALIRRVPEPAQGLVPLQGAVGCVEVLRLERPGRLGRPVAMTQAPRRQSSYQGVLQCCREEPGASD